VLSTEGHLRDALAALPADDPARPAVESIAARWRPAVVARLAAGLDPGTARLVFRDTAARLFGFDAAVLAAPL